MLMCGFIGVHLTARLRARACVHESLCWGEVRGMNQIGVCLLEGENGNRKRDSL